jgi:hypothetical protein
MVATALLSLDVRGWITDQTLVSLLRILMVGLLSGYYLEYRSL